MAKIGFLGCGNMASAFIKGLTEKGNVPFSDLMIHTRTKEKAAEFLRSGAEWCETPEMLASCPILFLCVKPQQVEEPLRRMAGHLSENALVVTMLAGKKISYFETVLGTNVHIIRMMPNTPLLLGCGATAVSVGANVTAEERAWISSVVGLLGEVAFIEEEQMDAIVAVNGSSPAYFYRFAESMIAWAKGQGIDENAASRLVIQSMFGSARMMAESGKSPAQLIRDVSSPGGTTLAALGSFDRDDLEAVVSRAMDACKNRSEELSSDKS